MPHVLPMHAPSGPALGYEHPSGVVLLCFVYMKDRAMKNGGGRRGNFL